MLRLTVAEVQHVRTLVLYLGAVAENLGTAPRTRFCRHWASELEPIERAVRDAAVALAADPDAAVEPLDGSPLGRAAHGVAYSVGAAGEWIDEQAARRREASGGARG